VYYTKRDYDRAIADYTQAIRLDPNLALAYLSRGAAYGNKGGYDRAIADWEAVLKIDPNNAQAKQNIEKARQARGY
jgi:tetratricopeptide (TPR) repeat protein